MSRTLHSQLDDPRGRLRSGRLYRFCRVATAARQRARFRELLARCNALPKDVDLVGWLRSELAHLIPLRKTLSSRLSDATIVGMGARGWERCGLCPSLQRSCDFHLFTDGLGDDVPLACRTADEQERRGRRSLEFVANVERTKPVHIIFLYVLTSNLAPRLLQQVHERGCWTVVVGLDDKHTFLRERIGELEVGVETVAHAADLYWTSWRTGCLIHHAIGSRGWLGGIGADPQFHRPVPVEKDIDVSVLGQVYGGRRELISKIRAYGIRIECRGHGWGGGHTSFEDLVRLYSRARVVLGYRMSVPWRMSPS